MLRLGMIFQKMKQRLPRFSLVDSIGIFELGSDVKLGRSGFVNEFNIEVLGAGVVSVVAELENGREGSFMGSGVGFQVFGLDFAGVEVVHGSARVPGSWV